MIHLQGIRRRRRRISFPNGKLRLSVLLLLLVYCILCAAQASPTPTPSYPSRIAFTTRAEYKTIQKEGRKEENPTSSIYIYTKAKATQVHF